MSNLGRGADLRYPRNRPIRRGQNSINEDDDEEFTEDPGFSPCNQENKGHTRSVSSCSPVPLGVCEASFGWKCGEMSEMAGVAMI